MNTEFWLEILEKNKIGFHQQEINSHLKSHWQSFECYTNCRVFVPLCGKTREYFMAMRARTQYSWSRNQPARCTRLFY